MGKQSFLPRSIDRKVRQLYPVIGDIIALPEFIAVEFSTHKGAAELKVDPKSVMKLMPLAAAFRELLELRDNQYYWKVDPKEAFRRSDAEYWLRASIIMLRTKITVLGE